jgi:hypothetical protein
MVFIRDHGPRNSNARLVLHTLRSFMDDSGSTFVGQTAIAAASCLSKPTVRKMLKLCWKEQWIGILSRVFEGQAWRHYEYRACIPDRLAIPDKHEMLVCTFAAKYGGEVDTDTHPDTPKVGNGLSHLNGEGGKNEGSKVGKPIAQGGKNNAQKVGNGLSPKSSSEVLMKLSPEEGAVASDRTVSLKRGSTEKPKEPETLQRAVDNKAESAAAIARIREKIRPLVTKTRITPARKTQTQ